MYSGYACLVTLRREGLLMRTWTSHCTENLFWNQGLSISPHIRVDTLVNEHISWLSDGVCTHVTLDALSLCLRLNIVTASDDGMGLSVEPPFGFRALTRSKKLDLEEWERVKTSHTGSPELQNRKSYRRPRKTSGTPQVKRFVTFHLCRSHRGEQLENQTHHHGNTVETQESAVFWCAPLPKTRVRNFIHPKQFGIFPKRLSLPYPDEEILSDYEEDVSSIRNGFFGMGENGPRNHSWASQCRCEMVPIQRSARHQPENTPHLAKTIITSTTTCPTD